MKSSKAKNIFLDIMYDIIGSFFYAVGVYTFAKKANFAPGGLTGLAIIINYLWKLPIGVMTIVLNIPLLLISSRILGKSFILKTIKSMVICTVFLDIIFPRFPAYSGSDFMAAVYFHIGRARLRALVSEDPYAPYILMVGNRVQIKRKLFEEYLDSANAV